MTHTPLLGQKVAFLVANGFSEKDLLEAQRGVQALGGNTRIVSMDQGLVNSWNGQSWGLNFAVDQTLNTALGADYDILVVPGGHKSAEKLQLTAHTKRFIKSFMDTGKPVVMLNEAVDLLVFSELVAGRTVAGEPVLVDRVGKAGGVRADGPIAVDGNLITCVLNDDNAGDVVEQIKSFLTSACMAEAVAA
ncbi:MAG: DJ-1/PfpI family protein [Bdellovibrionales bacterium]